MSVEYNVGIAYGYKLSADEISKLQENLETEVYEDLWDKYIILLNSWGNWHEGAIFGLQYVTLDEPGAAKIGDLTKLLEHHCNWNEEVEDVYAKYLALILGDREPDHYLFYQLY